MGKTKGRGLLVFKGDSAPPSKKKKAKKKSSKSKHSIAENERHTDDGKSFAGSNSSAASSSLSQQQRLPPPTSQQQQQQQQPQIQVGQGKISTSGNVVMGHDTLFQSQMRAGDAILATPTAPSSSSSSSSSSKASPPPQEEMRILTMILSDNSASLSTPFTHDLRLPTSYKYISKPRDAYAEKRSHQEKQKYQKEEEEKMAFGTYGKNDEIVYREKTEHGSYRIVREKVSGSGRRMDRGDLLDIRTKKKSDKYC